MKILKNKYLFFFFFFFCSSLFSLDIESFPWLAQDAISFLEDMLHKNPEAYILEFGSGGSTIWFAKRTPNVTAIEHHKGWYARVIEKLNNCEETFKVNYILHARPYYTLCDSFPEESFDLILIDGRNRKGCLVHSLKLLKPGGILMLDDSERRYYHEIFYYMKDWETVMAQQKKSVELNILHPRGHQTRWWIKPR